MYRPLRPQSSNLIAKVPVEGIIASEAPTGRTRPAHGDETVWVGDVMWRKATNKKHKTWDGDGSALYKNGILTVVCESRTIKFEMPLVEIRCGHVISKSGIDIELGDFTKRIRSHSEPAEVPQPVDKRFKPESLANVVSEIPQNVAALTTRQDLFTEFIPVRPSSGRAVEGLKRPVSTKGRSPTSKSFKGTLPSKITASFDFGVSLGRPRSLKGASESILADCEDSGEDFAIDPFIKPHLRPHQVVGVQFLHDCVMGRRHRWGFGGLLADDMGLGKTLTAIALIASLLRSKKIKNALVVVPVTLLGNWKAEFRKWLGENRIGVLVGTPGTDITAISHIGQKAYQVLVVGYERIRDASAQLVAAMGSFDLVVCDEGHRMKSRDSQTAQAIEAISSDKRVILTGTPIQNNLGEFYALAEFLNAGIFGSESKFNRRFTDVIAAAREPHATESKIEQGKERSDELLEVVTDFLLRRDISTISQHLSVPRSEYVVFCTPPAAQLVAYRDMVGTIGSQIEYADAAGGLQLVTALKKVANTALLASTERPPLTLAESSGKFAFLGRLLEQLRETDEKIVIVSGSTRILDLIQELCVNMSLPWLRLDGQTPQKKRQTSVDLFNKTSNKRAFAFLLSARSGGTGLNLTGASNMVIFDGDWNPAVDLQAMARVHRDGQKRPTFIYRLLTTGTIDEKIFQRQMNKTGLATSILDMGTEANVFTKDELRNLTTFREPLACDTLAKGTALDGYESVEAASLERIPESDILETVLIRRP